MESNRYYVSFDTKSNPGKVESVYVEIGNETIADMTRLRPINLAEHPLYRDLWQYCRENPPR